MDGEEGREEWIQQRATSRENFCCACQGNRHRNSQTLPLLKKKKFCTVQARIRSTSHCFLSIKIFLWFPGTKHATPRYCSRRPISLSVRSRKFPTVGLVFRFHRCTYNATQTKGNKVVVTNVSSQPFLMNVPSRIHEKFHPVLRVHFRPT